jgi:hypothetical protein
VSGTCWNRSTVRGVVNSGGEPRDPITGRRWALPILQWDVHEVVSLQTEGLEAEARSLFDRTLKYATTWSVYEIIQLHGVGLHSQADQLRVQTLPHARSWSVDDVIVLHEVGLNRAAWQLHKKTLPFVTTWSVHEITSLQNTGLQTGPGGLEVFVGSEEQSTQSF